MFGGATLSIGNTSCVARIFYRIQCFVCFCPPTRSSCATQISVGFQLVTYPALKKLGLASAPQTAAAAAAPARAPASGDGLQGQSAAAAYAHSQEMEAFYAKQVPCMRCKVMGVM